MGRPVIPALCIALPLVLAAILPWTPQPRWVSLGCAVFVLLLAASLPWTGSTLGGWLLPDPLAVHVVMLAAFAWLMAVAMEMAGSTIAVVVGLTALALLSDSAVLTALATGGAGIAAVLHGPSPGSLLGAAATGMALALFGAVLLYAGTAPALGPGWAALSWSALPGAGQHANGMALSAGFAVMLLGLGVSCGLVPLAASARGTALPRELAMVIGPLGGVWLVMALRLRGALDGNNHAIPPGWLMLATGLAGLGFAVACMRRPDGVLPAALIAMLAAALVGFGIGGAPATAAGLLHLTLGCLALTAAAAGSRLGLAALVGVPPLGVFASGFALVMHVAGRNGIIAALLGLGLFAVAAAALRALPPAKSGKWLGGVGVALALVGAWAMPPGITAWIQGIAAAAR